MFFQRAKGTKMINLKIILIWSFISGICLQAQWRYGPPMPTARHGMAAAVLDERIYIIGGTQAGRNGLKMVEVFDTAHENWIENIPDINYARINAAAVVFDGKIFLFGGKSRNEFISQVEVYDPVSNVWSSATDMPAPREGLCAVVVDSCIWIIGGRSANQERLHTIERYYPRSNSWDTLSYCLHTGRVGAVAGIYNNELYVFGGHFVEPLSSYEKFVPGKGWQIAGEMLYACGSAAAVFSDDKIWIAGGQGDTRILNNVQSLQVDDHFVWHEELSLKIGRKSLVLARVYNQIYAIGGSAGDNTQTSSDVVEIFDIVAAISENAAMSVISHLELAPSYPNPFNSMTTIRVYTPAYTYTTITIYNMLGEKVRQLYAGYIRGWQQFHFDASDDQGKTVPSGQYFLYLTSPNEKRVQKLIFAK
jgi:N-acetylneuraminic acid mutarotase